MRFLSISITNFGLFNGQHRFDLVTQAPSANIVLFRGHNGAGKSTLFEALSLGLYGSLALGDRITVADYQQYLFDKFHRKRGGGSLRRDVAHDAAVCVSFEYVQSGQPSRVSVERIWRRNGRAVTEEARIIVNGHAPDIPLQDQQFFIQELVPLGLRSLCFFDAEQVGNAGKLQRGIAGGRAADLLTGTALHRLLGLDLVDRLQDDLDYFLTKQGGASSKVDRVREAVLYHQSQVERLTAELATLETEAERMMEYQENLQRSAAAKESELAAAGGGYAERRPKLQIRLAQIDDERSRASANVESLAAHLLPFAFASRLCAQLLDRLSTEETTLHRLAATRLWQQNASAVEAAVETDEIWQKVDVPLELRRGFAQRLVTLLSPDVDREPEEYWMRHAISEGERSQLRNWLREVLTELPLLLPTLSRQMTDLDKEWAETSINISRAPDEAILVPIHKEITGVKEELSLLTVRQAELRERIGAIRYQLENHVRQRGKASDELESLGTSARNHAMASRTKSALRSYQQALLSTRLAELEVAVQNAFNMVCAKERLISGVKIDPATFATVLHGADGEDVPLQTLSAGEQQLYVMSLLWALRQVSGRSLPLAVDTPLARLDARHKTQVLSHYIPAVSDQVLLFGTDEELGDAEIQRLQPHIAKAYSLTYDEELQATCVEEWAEFGAVICP